MKKRLLLNLIILVLALTILPHCGGGGGGGNSNGPGGPTTAVLTLSTALTSSLPDNETVNGYEVTVTLPAGVTVKTANTGTTLIDSSVLTASGAGTGSLIAGDYSPAIVGTPGKVTIIIANTNNISAGEFCKVTCTIASGDPSASDFQQYTFGAKGYAHTDFGQPDDIITDVDLSSQLTLSVSAAIY